MPLFLFRILALEKPVIRKDFLTETISGVLSAENCFRNHLLVFTCLKRVGIKKESLGPYFWLLMARC